LEHFGRYDRQARIHQWNQGALENSRVIIVGAGALGNEILKNLALVGVGNILVIDFDSIELSNLSRCVLFSSAEIGKDKAETAAHNARLLNPEISIKSYNGNVLYDLGLGLFRAADLVIGGLDNLAARSHLGKCCSLAGVPYLDGAMWAMGGEVRWFWPGQAACFQCTLSDEDKTRMMERYSCSGFKNTDSGDDYLFPATISTTAVVGGLLSREAAGFLMGWKQPGSDSEALVYNGIKHSLHWALLERDTACLFHSCYGDVIRLEYRAAELTAGELLDRAGALLGKPCILNLGRDLVVELFCKTCNRKEELFQLAERTEENSLVCSHCGERRCASVVSELDGSEEICNLTMKQLAVPPGEILSVRPGNSDELVFFELSGDVKELWSGQAFINSKS